MKDPIGAGARFTAFLKNGARFFFGALVLLVNRAKPFNPASFIGNGWAIWKGLATGYGLTGDEQQDVRSLALTQVDWNQVLFRTCLEGEEISITGEEKLKRLQKSGEILLDAAVGEDLWLDYKAKGKDSVLEGLRQRGVTYLDFFGTILRDPHGRRYVLYLCFDGGRWRWDYYWLGGDWYAGHGSAALASPPAEVPTPAAV